MQYQSINKNFWEGRVDGTERDSARWHQVIETIDLEKEELPALTAEQKGIVILGFKSEEGVKRNNGRLGTVDASYELRKACMSFPVHFDENTTLIDGGNIFCENRDLEKAQALLGEVIAKILIAGYRPVVFGGGHEVAYGHYLGLKAFMAEKHPDKTLGIVNFDAHFDLKEPKEEGGTSCTSFWQIAQDMKADNKAFKYMVLGIQKNSNTKKQFDTAKELNVEYIQARKFNTTDKPEVFQKISHFLDSVDFVYNTNCMDVFSCTFAPGVTASSYMGLIPDAFFLKSFKKIYKSEKVIAADVAELNPKYDMDSRTSKLAASLVFEIVHAL